MNGIPTELPEEYLEYVLMTRMGWSYHELMETPAKVISGLLKIFSIESQHQQNRNIDG